MRHLRTIWILISLGFTSAGCTEQGGAVEVQRDSNALIAAEPPGQMLIAQSALEGATVWTERDKGSGAHCVLKSALQGDPDGVQLLANTAVGAGFVQVDTNGYIWGDAAGIHACS